MKVYTFGIYRRLRLADVFPATGERTSVQACCLRCGYLVTGTSYTGLGESISRLKSNLWNHWHGKKCRSLQKIWGSPRAAWGR